MLNLIDRSPSIYRELNKTDERYPETETITSCFRRAATLNAHKAAISFGDIELSYAELDHKSSQVADMLAKAGCRKGDFIGIYMERSPETVISIFGVLRLGGTYVPIDPEHPIERNRYILDNASCKQLIIKDKYAETAGNLSLSLGVGRPVSVEHCFAEGEGGFEDASLSPDDLAYVIYTSGSTGKPKGTLIAHRGVVNLWNTFTQSLGLTNEDVITQFSTFSFDASILDTFNGLLSGAKLVILTKEEQLTPELFLDLLERQQVTQIGCIPTSVFNRLAEATTQAPEAKWQRVKNIIVGGEALLSDHVRKFQDKFGTKTTIMNAYGPTECTVITTTYKVTDYWKSQSVSVPIGYPIGNYKLYVVKPDGTLADVGEEGELYIETFALAKGYLNLPEKTNEVFVANPFSTEPGSFVYKSGDIVKILPEGSIEFQYRKDGQLKLRGFRIEIGEIENALSKHPAVLDAAVVAIKDNNVVKHLSCFYTEKKAVSSAELREHLKSYVPYYMIPSYFYHLEQIPLSPTGKVDRNKLIMMDNVDLAESDMPYEAPVGDLEQAIAAVWCEVLGHTKVSRNVSFFEIGGDSLAVMMALSHLKLDYLSLRMNDLYEHKTVQELAMHISTLTAHSDEEDIEITEFKSLKELPVLPKIEVQGKDGLGTDILVTGGTGYLGSHLIYELLTTTEATIHTLVRSKVGENGISRVWSTLDTYFGQDLFTKYTNRLRVVEGDLVSKNLGLSADDFQRLASTITSIIHAGADVRHFGSAGEFQATNVIGTQNLLQFVYDKPSIAFHFISTIGIPEDMAAAGIWETVSEHAVDFFDVKLESVYTNSKLQAEKVVAEAIQAGLPCSIYRAGNLSCHSVTGHFQKNINENFFYRMIKAFLLLGKAPSVNTHVDITPVNFAASFMVDLMKQRTLGEVYHICNPVQERYEALIDALTAQGYAIDLVPLKEFERWVLQEGNKVSQEGVQLAMALLDGDGVRTSPYSYSSEASFRKMSAAVSLPGVEELASKLVAHAVDRGYFPTA
ncbi:amino acid adenylation domain-containing protein [Paenibacillus aestuarii]|uniref:Amino acid adenylation domain-containing protein n=1 Tax=Paenibacillus aestuarii TaxID=516965 RepID=A0ABW0K7B3_9BACL|nr:amino acid adenylation domain-containing protein [Paenibacillus aestuarii]